jgi:hypothetical protein
MLALILGGAVLVLLLLGLRAFERASVTSIKRFISWIAVLGGLALLLLLVLSGRLGIALVALPFLAPALWARLRGGSTGASPGAGPGFGDFADRFAQGLGQGVGQGPGAGSAGGSSGGRMTPEEAYAVLGLAPGASADEIQAAYVRLMSAAHPDKGGSDWLAARVNMARDVLTGRTGSRRA